MDGIVGPPQFRPPDDGCEETTTRRLSTWAIQLQSWATQTVVPEINRLRSVQSGLKLWRESEEKKSQEAKGRRALLTSIIAAASSLGAIVAAKLLDKFF